mmetsp:Transcript_37879/g.102549  ORF Transcript_37879/g.102549 Transcript_37879/m.102549 type:complete len:339 (-) Transcript_37879:37-1053(-)
MDFLSSTAAPFLDDKGAMAAVGEGPFCKWWHFSVAMALSGAAGIRATLPVFLLSLLHQIEPEDFPLSDQVHWLRRPEICMLLGVVLLVEVLADQIPAVDHALHAILLPVHPLMGAAAAIAPDYCGGIYTRVPMALVGGSLASMVHSGKALARAGSSGSSCGMLNPVMSHCENLSAVALVVLSIMSPVFALGASVLFIYAAYLGFKWTRRALDLEGEDREAGSKDEETGRAEQRLPFVASAPPLDSYVNYSSREPQRSVDAPRAGKGDLRGEAQREVDRVLAAPNLHWVLGGGTSAETKQEYRRLLRLLHPDRGLCSGERAASALRRVAEAHSVLHADA